MTKLRKELVEKELVEKELAFFNKTDNEDDLNHVPMIFSAAFEQLSHQFLHTSNCGAICLYYEATLAAARISLQAPFFGSLAQNLLLVQNVCDRADRCVHMELCLAECTAEILIRLPGGYQKDETKVILESFEGAISRLESGKKKHDGILRQAILEFRLAKYLSPVDDLLKSLKKSLDGIVFEKEPTLRFERMARDLRLLASELEFIGLIGEKDVESWMKDLWDEEKI